MQQSAPGVLKSTAGRATRAAGARAAPGKCRDAYNPAREEIGRSGQKNGRYQAVTSKSREKRNLLVLALPSRYQASISLFFLYLELRILKKEVKW